MSGTRSSERLQVKKRDSISNAGADLVQPPTKNQAQQGQVVSSSTRGRKRKLSLIQDNSSNNGPSKPSKIPRLRSMSVSSEQRITGFNTASQEKKDANPKPPQQTEVKLSRKRKLSTSTSTEKSIKKQRLNTVKDEPIGENKVKDEKINQENIKEQQKEPEFITAKDEEQKLQGLLQYDDEKAKNENKDEKELSEVTDDAELVENQVRESIPKFMEPFIVSCQDVEGDGNCGFRAVAVSAKLRKGQDAHQSLRLSLRSLFRKNLKYYVPICNMLTITVEEVTECLSWNGEKCAEDEKFWLQMPFHGYLIADLFKKPVIFMSKAMSATFFPKTAPPKNISKVKPISFVLQDNIGDDYYHYIPITLSENSPIPNVCVCIDSQGSEFQVPNHEAWTRLMADRITDRFNSDKTH